MISSEFSTKLSNFPHLKKFYQGIFSADNLPKLIKKNHFIICNTDVSTGEGKHWYAVLRLETDCLELFDSLGIDEEKRSFIKRKFQLKRISKVKFNVTQVQSSKTSTCGLFVLYFLVNRFHNKDMSFTDLLNDIFVHSESQNETLVKQFCDEHFF